MMRDKANVFDSVAPDEPDWRCVCGPDREMWTPIDLCLCGRSPTLRETVEIRCGTDGVVRCRRRISHPRVLDVVHVNGVVEGHVLPLGVWDVGTTSERWRLEFAVSTSQEQAELRLQGVPFQVARRLAEVRWLAEARTRPVRLVDAAANLLVIDAVENADDEPLELVVARARV